MIDFSIIFVITLLVAGVVNLFYEFKRDLMMYQQNSYRNERYMRWLSTSGDTTSLVRLLTYIAIMVMLVPQLSYMFCCCVALIPLCINVGKLIVARYKKPLVWTNRVKRIFAVASLLSVGICVAAWFIWKSWYVVDVALLVIFAMSHVIIMLSGILLKPVEASINRKYYNEAASILRSMPDLTVIGVTGSYGKTSTKHYLNRILSEKYDVLMTPGSYNTTMGVIRTVREMMKPYNEIFICEMGAKNIGDIKEICDLVHPSIGIVTAVGEQHLESFKTIENVQRTKFELVDSLPENGLAVINDDFPFAASRNVDNVKALRYAVRAVDNADYRVTSVVYDETGTSFSMQGPEGEFSFHTRLVGECNISNLMGAVIVALYLKVPVDKIQYAISKIEQVEHRLNLKRTPGGITIIDDAFNSNPTGSKMALDVLAGMTKGKRIVITPGMIELGDKQHEYNAELGRHIAASTDVAIIVGEYNRDAILEGLKSADMPEEKVKVVDSFKEAQVVLGSIVKPGDTVLYENDLPDTFK